MPKPIVPSLTDKALPNSSGVPRILLLKAERRTRPESRSGEPRSSTGDRNRFPGCSGLQPAQVWDSTTFRDGGKQGRVTRGAGRVGEPEASHPTSPHSALSSKFPSDTEHHKP